MDGEELSGPLVAPAPTAGGRRCGTARMNTMGSEVVGQAEADEEILAFDIPDDALERAANAEQKGFTLVYCTSPWYNCGLPQ